MKKITTHGPGAAHIGFSMFGARGPLRSGEDVSNGAAVPPAPPPSATPPAPGEPAPPAPGAAASEKMLPQSQVSALIAAEKRDTEAKTRAKVLQEIKDAEAAKVSPAKPKTEVSGTLSHADVQNIITRNREFDRAVITAGLSDRQISRMSQAMAADAPDNVAAWSAQYLEDMGITKAPAAAAAPTPPASAATPPEPQRATPAAAPSAPTSPVAPYTSGGLLDPLRLSAEQMDQLGIAGVREAHEKALTVGRQMNGAPPRPKVPARR